MFGNQKCFHHFYTRLVHDFDYQRYTFFWTYNFDKFEHFEDSRVDQIVTPLVGEQSFYNWRKKISLDDVPVVELIFQSYNLPKQAKGIWKKTRKKLGVLEVRSRHSACTYYIHRHIWSEQT